MARGMELFKVRPEWINEPSDMGSFLSLTLWLGQHLRNLASHLYLRLSSFWTSNEPHPDLSLFPLLFFRCQFSRRFPPICSNSLYIIEWDCFSRSLMHSLLNTNCILVFIDVITLYAADNLYLKRSYNIRIV